MKILNSLLFAVLLAGCSSVQERDELAFWAGWTAQNSASIHMMVDYRSVPAYCLARAAIGAIIIDGEYSAGRLQEALELLPIEDKTMTSAQGKLVWSSAIPLWQRYGQKVIELDETGTVEAVVKSVYQGLQTALVPYYCY